MLKSTKKVNKFYLSGSVASSSPGLSPFDYTTLAVSCSSESTRRRLGMSMNSRSDWLSLEQHITDTAINGWRKRLLPVFAQRVDIANIYWKQLDN